MNVKISSPNLNEVVGQLKALVKGIPIAKGQSSRLIAEQILEDSLTLPPFVPEDSGDLRSTGRVVPVKEGYAVVYGGVAESGRFVDYAGYVHDDLRPRKYTIPGSGPKFVETHFLRRAEEAPERIADIMMDLIDGIITEGR